MTLLERLTAQSDGFLLARDDCKRIAVGRVNDGEFDGIRSDVYRCEFQLQAL